MQVNREIKYLSKLYYYRCIIYIKLDPLLPNLTIFGTGAGKPTPHRHNSSMLFSYDNLHLLLDVGSYWYEDLCLYYNNYAAENV